MSAKEKAIEVCGATPIARHINDDRFSVGWYMDRLYETGVGLYETGVGSKVDDEGLFFWADTGYGDCDNPCWEWEDRPYAKGLMHAFHRELAAVLCGGIPLQVTRFSTPGCELQVLGQMFDRVTINGHALLRGTGGYTYVPVSNPRMAICLEADKLAGGLGWTVRLRNNAGGVVCKVLTGEICDDLYDLLIGLFDMIDTPQGY